MNLRDKKVSNLIREKKSKILPLIDTAGKMKKLCIYDVEFKPSVVRVYIDNEAHCIDLNICEDFMRTLLFLFRSEGMDNIECEVSSPGLERQLKRDWHFQKAVGETVKIYTREPVFCYDEKTGKKRKKTVLNGKMYKYQDNFISVKEGVLKWLIPLSIIKKASVIFDTKTQS